MIASRFGCSLRDFRLSATVLLLALAELPSILQPQAQQLAATYRQGNLSVTIPYNSSEAG